MSARKINTDRILGISAMIISILTLAIFIYQTDIMRVQSKLSVKPRFDFTTNFDQVDSLIQIQEVMINKGLGPGIIDSIYFIYQGRRHPLNTKALLESEIPKLLKYGHLAQHSTLSQGATLSPNEEYVLFTYRFEPSKLDSVMHYVDMNNNDDSPFQIEVVYTSIYEDDHWKANSTKNQPLKME